MSAAQQGSPPSRFWRTRRGTVCLRDETKTGRVIVREFWAPQSRGPVYEIFADNPNGLGNPVCRQLAADGQIIATNFDGLLALIRREYHARLDRERRERFF